MQVYEIIMESRELQEGPILNKIGTAVGKGVGTAAKGVGAVAGGAVGALQAIKKGYQAGKAAVAGGGDAPAPNTGEYGRVSKDGSKIWNKKTQSWEPYEQPSAKTAASSSGASAGSSAAPSASTAMSLTQIKQAADQLRNRDKQSLLKYLQQKISAVQAAKSAPAAPAAAPAKAPGVKIAGQKAAAKPKATVAV